MLAYFVKQCSDSSDWYAGLVGCLLPPVPSHNSDGAAEVWVREPLYPHCANHVQRDDVQLIAVPDGTPMWVPRPPPTAAEVTAPLLAALNERVINS